MKTIREPAVDIEVYAECDVLVAGSSVFGNDDPAAACRMISESAHSGIRGII